jgi:hypothetical protein
MIRRQTIFLRSAFVLGRMFDFAMGDMIEHSTL